MNEGPQIPELPIRVTRRQMEAIDAVRRSGYTNMLDFTGVRVMMVLLGYGDVVQWVEENKRAYGIGILTGDWEITDAGREECSC